MADALSVRGESSSHSIRLVRSKTRAPRLSSESMDKVTLQKLTPLDDDEAEKLTSKLNKNLVSLFLEQKTQSTLYFALFRSMDSRRRGVVTFEEFLDMVRIGLRVSKDFAKDSAIGGLWKRVDKKSSGAMPVAGFIKCVVSWKNSGPC